MRQIKHYDLSEATQTQLDKHQKSVTDKAIFGEQVEEAIRVWKPKNKAFDEIMGLLKEKMSISGYCCYCETGIGTVIEHIYPKSKYPELSYTWLNYLLACDRCNSNEKRDKFALFHTINDETTIIHLPPNSKPIESTDKPISDDGLIINPRTENPADFLSVQMLGQKPTFFLTVTNFDTTSRNYQRAEYTVNQLLKLNDVKMAAARKTAYTDFMNYLTKYTQCQKAQNFVDLKKVIDGDQPWINENKPFEDEKRRISANFKQLILKNPHRTVWDEIKRQRVFLPKTNDLFESAAEAETW